MESKLGCKEDKNTDRDLSMFIHRPPSYVIIYRSYKLKKMDRFLVTLYKVVSEK